MPKISQIFIILLIISSFVISAIWTSPKRLTGYSESLDEFQICEVGNRDYILWVEKNKKAYSVRIGLIQVDSSERKISKVKTITATIGVHPSVSARFDTKQRKFYISYLSRINEVTLVSVTEDLKEIKKVSSYKSGDMIYSPEYRHGNVNTEKPIREIVLVELSKGLAMLKVISLKSEGNKIISTKTFKKGEYPVKVDFCHKLIKNKKNKTINSTGIYYYYKGMDKNAGTMGVFSSKNNLEDTWSLAASKNISEIAVDHYKQGYPICFSQEKDGQKQLMLINEYGEDPLLISDFPLDPYMPFIYKKDKRNVVFWVEMMNGVYTIKTKYYDELLDSKKEAEVFRSSKNAYYPKGFNTDNKRRLYSLNEAAKNKFAIYYREEDRYVEPFTFKSIPLSNKAYKPSEVYLEWNPVKDDSGISGYGFIIDKNPDSIPALENLPVSKTSLTPGLLLSEGKNYIHLVAFDKAGNMNRPEHIMVNINSYGTEISRSETGGETK